MEEIRFGKDVAVGWRLKKKPGFVSLFERNLTLEMSYGTKKKFMPFRVIEENKVVVTYYGKDHEQTGIHTLTLWENYGMIGEGAVDALSVFKLVPWSTMEKHDSAGDLDVVTVEIETEDIEAGIRGLSPYEIALLHGFVGTEKEWLDSLGAPAREAAEKLDEKFKTETDKLSKDYNDKIDALKKDYDSKTKALSDDYESKKKALGNDYDSVKSDLEKDYQKAKSDLALDYAETLKGIVDLYAKKHADLVADYAQKQQQLETSINNKETELEGKVNAAIGKLPTDVIGDAPKDGKEYARKNGTWSEVVGGKGGGEVNSVNGQKGDVELNIPSKTSQLQNDSNFLTQHQSLSGKQDVISDLATIRSGAALGATAVQPSAITDMETKTHASATYQPKGNYLTEHQDISGKADKADTYTKTEVDALIGQGGGGSNGILVEVRENGFFVVDSNYNVGFSVTDEGCSGINI